MFLIEGSGKAILYTGDIRSESWWVNSLVRNPVLLPYATGARTLDTIYLDTTFASKAGLYRDFQSKAQGLKELVEKVRLYPKESVFFVEAWTFGYEDVWIALSSFLEQKIHLDQYRYGIYASLAKANNGLGCLESPALAGFKVGNHYKEGCLTRDHRTRIHSCERGFACPVIDEFRNPNIVRIVPIISRTAGGTEMHELGVGGGKGDLDQVHELELQDSSTLRMLIQRCASSISDQTTLSSVHQMLTEAFKDGKSRSKLGSWLNGIEAIDDVKLDKFIDILARQANHKPNHGLESEDRTSASRTNDLPREITFPYSRHSSYHELCALVEAFHPRDIYPCTVDKETWDPSVSMRSLFGHLCSGDEFAHDAEMLEHYEERQGRESIQKSLHTEVTRPSHANVGETDLEFSTPRGGSPACNAASANQRNGHASCSGSSPLSLTSSDFCHCESQEAERPQSQKGLLSQTYAEEADEEQEEVGLLRTENRSIRQWAYFAATGLDPDCDSWDAFGGLACVKGSAQEQEL